MFAESTGGISSLVNSDRECGSVSPEIERENPFRDAMMKFSSMEKEEQKTTTVPSPRKQSMNKSTETTAMRTEVASVAMDSKSTQTFRSVLKAQLSCPTTRSRSTNGRVNGGRGQQQQLQQQLSYTSTPRPYMAGQINRSLSMGQALHQAATGAASNNPTATGPSNEEARMRLQ